MKKNRLILALAMAIMLVWVLTAAWQVIRAYLYTFGKLLYSQHNNLSTSNLFMSFLRGHTLFILSSMFALLFLTLYIVTATGVDDIMKCALLLLSAAGFDVCAWNRDALFFTSPALRYFWLHTHDAMLLIFGFVILVLLLPRLISSHALRQRILWVSVGALGVCMAMLWLNPPVRANLAFIPAAVFLLLLTVGFFAIQLIRRERIQRLFDALLLLPVCATMLMRNELFTIESPLRNYYLRMATYIVVFYAIGISFYVLVWQMSNIFLRRSQNRRFEEIMRIKTDVSGLLVNYCRPPAKQITALSRLALDGRFGALTHTQRQILFDMQDEVNKLNRALRNIGEFEALPAPTPPLQMQPIRMGTVFNYVVNEMPGAVVELDNVSQWHELYAMGEPYALIRANTQYCAAIAEIRDDQKIHISCALDGHYIQVELSVGFASIHLRRVRRICRIVNRGSVFSGVEEPSDMALYNTHSTFSRHGSPPVADVLEEGGRHILRCRYNLQHCPPKARAASLAQDRANASESGTETKPRILLFSTSDEEIELISSFLAYEPCQISIVTSEKTLFRNPDRLRDYAVLIIGSVFMDSSIYEICWMIREQYTLGQLPILLVQRDPDLQTHVAAQKLANSVTTALSDRFEFCQKVHTLVQLRNSIQSANTTQLAFLQAQMNPHFIFNTMNTIMALCLSEPMKAYELLGDFSKYLRGNLYSKDLNQPYPVYEEVDLLTAYLSIEKARFGEQIAYEIDSNVPDDWNILPMLIEPLVENSVKHGKRSNAVLHIRVCLSVSGNSMVVSIEDDGAGFNPEAQLQSVTESEPHSKSIGLDNVKARLKLFYNAPLIVDSAPGAGTRVSFTITPQG